MPIHTPPRMWILETANTAYAFGLNEAGLLTHTYWGKRLPNLSDYPAPHNFPGWASFNGAKQVIREEYAAYGGTSYVEPCLKVTFADGVRDTVLQFVRAVQQGETLHITLTDSAYPLEVILTYRVLAEYDLIERYVTVINHSDQPITLERVWSAQWHLPLGDGYHLKHLTGRWLDEWHIHHEPLVNGVKVLESRRLTTSHHHNPYFAIDRGNASEDHGEVWFGVLAWSGNWKIAAEVTDFHSTRVNIGLNDFDFAWQLPPTQAFITPPSIAGYTPDGFGAASHRLHDYIREQVVPHPNVTRKILYNSWEATLFNVDEPSQIQLAELAAQMGVELFVMDDGWFHKRNSDNAGLGDWWPDETKFPNGLNPLIEAVNRLGMEFGLWVEPEMVNPDSDLYRTHPDWVIHFPTRARTEARNQLILNVARQDVQEYLIALLDDLLTRHNIAFIKWDMNRNVSEPGWPSYDGEQRELWVRYVQGVYHVWGTLRERHPNVIWQSCSGGGGRADLGILRLADQIWISDNTYPAPRLNIQEGYSQVFPASTMEAWVTDSGKREGMPEPLSFRFHVSMCGSLGVGGNLPEWTPAERAEAAGYIAQYKQIRHIVQFGDMYRLQSAQNGAFSAVQYVTKDQSESVIFAFRTHLPHPSVLPPLYLRGLDAETLYEQVGTSKRMSGAGWMYTGLLLELADWRSEVIHLQQA